MSSTANFPAAPQLGLVQIVPADTTSQKTVLTAGGAGSKVTSVVANSDDTNARVITLSVLRSGTNYPVSVVSVPANAGTDGSTPSVDLLNETLLPGLPVDNDGQRYLLLEDGDSLQVKSGSTVTSAKAVTVKAVGASF